MCFFVFFYCNFVIELEAQAIERARNRTASTASLERTDGEDDIKYTVLASEGTILKSQLYRVVFGVSEKKKKKADDAYKKAMAATDEGLASPPLPMPELYLEPVGPVFQRIQAASWDLVSGHVALAMGDTNRVTVLSCGKDRSSFADNVVSVIGSVQLSEGHAPQPLRCFVQHMHWLSGSLFVCSPTCVHVVFIVCFETGTQLKAFPVASLHHTTIDPSRSKSYFGCSLPSRPFGCLESVSISSGCLVVSSPSAAMSALPLTWSPVVVIGLLAGTLNSITTSINLDTVLPWVQVVPSALHAHVYSLYEGLIPKGERNSTFGAVSFKEISALLSTDEVIIFSWC